MQSETAMEPLLFEPYNWMKEIKIYNKNGNIVPPEWLEENAEVVVLLFTSKGVDREGIIKRFYSIYESVKVVSVAIEVIYVPFDETEEEYKASYEEQANWFTLQFDDPLVPILKYAYGITCLPHMVVLKPDCSVISWHGLLDLETYGKNAVITWLGTNASSKNRRRMSKDAEMYGDCWRYVSDENTIKKSTQRKFSGSSGLTSVSTKK